MEIATLGGGCYWCLDAFYRYVRGIENVSSGYSGGHVDNPSTEDVYEGNTGHAEVVQLKFDPKIISYEEILKIFFVMHDPTTLNRQGYDVGELYRSVIFYHDEKQREIAENLIKSFATPLYPNPVVTQLVKFEKFWLANEDMQDFYSKNPNTGYCLAVIDPKIQKLRKEFSKYLK